MGVKAMQFTGGGEPTVHPDHLKIFQYAQNLGLETALVTNGLRLDPTSPAIQALKWIRVSIDAGDAKTYAKVRRVPPQHFMKVWDNVDTLALNFEGVLGIGFVATPENWQGMADAALRARDAGADNMRVGAVFSTEGLDYYGHDLYPRIAEEVALVKAEMDNDSFTIINQFGVRIDDLEGGSPTDPECGYQHITVYIGGDLNVYRCCSTSYTLAGNVGSLREQSFADFISNAQSAYYPFDARSCRYCQFRGQNAVIKALITPPEHVNFV